MNIEINLIQIICRMKIMNQRGEEISLIAVKDAFKIEKRVIKSFPTIDCEISLMKIRAREGKK